MASSDLYEQIMAVTDSKISADKSLEEEQKKDQENYEKYIKSLTKDGLALSEESRGYDSSLYGNVSLGQINLLGVPFQYLPSTDPRYISRNRQMGRIYDSYVLAQAPIVHFQVGRPRFMYEEGIVGKVMNYGLADDVAKMLATAIAGDGGANAVEVATSGFNETRYYSFENDFATYAAYVDSLVSYVGVKMGIEGASAFRIRDRLKGTGAYGGNSGVTDGSNASNNWTGWVDDHLTKNGMQFVATAMGDLQYISFFADADTSYSESGSNTVGDSALLGVLGSASGLKREVDFLFGKYAQTSDTFNTNGYEEAVSGIFNGAVESTKIGKVINGILPTITSGGQILFPQVWQDSEFSKQISLSFKFQSPYGDKQSIFENVYVPFFCVLAMALPRQNSKMGYEGPFVLRCSSKGWFGCELGMIDSIDVQKGGDGTAWSIEGFPTEINVTITIRDLYPTIMMTMNKKLTNLFFHNTGLMEYLDVMGGIPVHQFNEFERMITAIKLIGGKLLKLTSLSFWSDLIADRLYRMYNSVAKAFMIN